MQAADNKADLAKKFEDYRTEFVIVDSYISCVAVALLQEPRRRRWRPWRQKSSIKTKYDGATVGKLQPEFETVLWQTRAREREVSVSLSGQPRRLLVEMLFSVCVFLFSVLDSVHKVNDPHDHKNPTMTEAQRDRIKGLFRLRKARFCHSTTLRRRQ
jgi:hypothetical protein